MGAPNEPIILGPGEGRTFHFGRRIMITKVDEEDTEDVAIFETRPDPGVPTALPHRHWETVEAFYVLWLGRWNSWWGSASCVAQLAPSS